MGEAFPAPICLITARLQEEDMAAKLDNRGWTAAQHLAPCVICHEPAILPSPRGKPCQWTCAVAWVSEHEAQADEREGRAA
jgi:hypothetical protein